MVSKSHDLESPSKQKSLHLPLPFRLRAVPHPFSGLVRLGRRLAAHGEPIRKVLRVEANPSSWWCKRRWFGGHFIIVCGKGVFSQVLPF